MRIRENTALGAHKFPAPNAFPTCLPPVAFSMGREHSSLSWISFYREKWPPWQHSSLLLGKPASNEVTDTTATPTVLPAPPYSANPTGCCLHHTFRFSTQSALSKKEILLTNVTEESGAPFPPSLHSAFPCGASILR